jgi:hypothetical protein
MNIQVVLAALRTSRRAQFLATGGGALIVIIVLAAGLGRSGPVSGPGASPSVEPSLVGYQLPRPSTTDVVLVVAAPDALSARESSWLADLRVEFGLVDVVAAKDATLAALQQYLTVFVIDQQPDLDVAALRETFASGLTVNLAGSASTYRAQMLASPAP